MTYPALSSPTARLFGLELRDVLRGKGVLAYGLFFLVLTDVFFRFSGGGEQVVLSLINVVLILVPLISLVYGVGYLYSAREFTELMLAQPVRRGDLFLALYGGLAAPLSIGFVLGVGLPFVWHGAAAVHAAPLLRLLVSGVLLTAAFVALAMLLATRFDNRVKGLGVALMLWLALAVVYDGLVLLVAYTFSAYPLETPMLVLTALNPISLARVLLLLSIDVAALLGYTGAAFERVLGTGLGSVLSFATLLLWAIIPLVLAFRLFSKKDF